ncbi:glycosyltransferase family 2 protein [Gimesia maris]|uniref:glycosyltransferase family 2 protein n=1 Tax=Gimesia maris TaxID=122 RepID=UPI00241CB65A|nr:glycosyltransferase family 2 protein [Gimesia maris]|tara:strand:- start:141851 stop:144562 length:2712 start_codon:yes stop_codon:yes gene_type:complete
MSKKSLQHIYKNHEGKVSDKWTLYISEYERLFADFRTVPVRLLEIGIQNGGSLDIWSKYFDTLKKAVGCEINPDSGKLKYENPNVMVVIGDANEDPTEQEILEQCQSFEIIIDDGSHKSSDIISSFNRYFPYLENNGVYVAEDLHCSYWNEFGGGLFDPFSSMAFFKYLADIINHESWGINKKRVDLLRNFEEHYQLSFNEDILRTIHSIEFMNSMCVIHKASPEQNLLGERIITGQSDEVLSLSNMPRDFEKFVPDESDNKWSSHSFNLELSYSSKLKEIEQLKKQNSTFEEEIANLKQTNTDLNQLVQNILNSHSWLITRPLRGFGRAARSLKKLIDPRRYQDMTSNYDVWSRVTGIKEAEEILTRLPELKSPLISIILPTYNTKEKILRACIESVLAQTYSNWELCIADDASTKSRVRDVINEYSKQDSRIKSVFRTENGHISEAMISAAELMEGDYISFLDHDDELNKNALLFIVDAINRSPESEFFYSDEDHINEHGKHQSPFFKPDWSPSLLCSQNYIGHFLCLSKSLYERVGGIRRGFDGAQDYDLVLRAGDAAENVYHIPKVLYHWREHENSTSSNSECKPYAHDAGKAAVADFLNQKYGSRFIKVNDGEGLFTYSPQFRFDSEHRVSIIIPTKDKIDLLDDCIESIRNRSSHINWEIIIVDNRSEETASKEYFSTVVQDSRIKVVEADVEFNWSMINNIGAKAATGDVFVFLNNDTLVITPDWIEKLASMASLPEVGLVGPQLLYEDNTIQHAGVVVGMGGWADHVFKNQLPVHRSGPFVSPMLNRNVLAITGACQVIERAKFEQLGGFDEQFIICGSDVDICIRAHQQGLQNVYCADAALHHLESKSRSSFIPKQDFLMSEIRYAPYRNEKGDPYFNENLDLMSTMPRMLTNA